MTHTETFKLFQLNKECTRLERAAATARKRYEAALGALITAECELMIARRHRTAALITAECDQHLMKQNKNDLARSRRTALRKTAQAQTLPLPAALDS